MPRTLFELQSALQSGSATSLQLTQRALERTQDPAGQGHLAFTRVYREEALAAARASDLLRSAGIVRSPLEGLPISIKDLFDVAGEPTLSGSKVLRDAPAATQDALIVRRLTAAGAVITGKTNMVEFAFSGLGLNPHYGTPRNPWDRQAGRIPGGSSSGAAVAVADGMSVVSIGSDTGGSVRIPSAFCGLTGFKPTARRIPTQGALPLSTTLDSIGGLTASVACCAVVDAILSGTVERCRPAGGRRLPGHTGQPPADDLARSTSRARTATPQEQAFGLLEPPAANTLSLAIPAALMLDGADDTVRSTFSQALEALRRAGARIETIDIPEFAQLPQLNSQGGLIAAEAWAWHRSLLESRISEYDPRVSSRILRGRDITAADYIDLLAARQRWIAAVETRLRPYDALLMPTVPTVAPLIRDLEASDEAYFSTNALTLRNCTYINFLDGCALSMPCHTAGQPPVGLMVAGAAMQDQHILNTGAAIEAVLQPITGTHR